MVWMLFCSNLPARSLAVSRELARNPSCRLTTGGLYRMTCFLPRGAPFESTSVTGSPSIRSASSAGFAIVAEQKMNCGFDP